MTRTGQAVTSFESRKWAHSLLSKKFPGGDIPSSTLVAPREVSGRQSEALLGICQLGRTLWLWVMLTVAL